MVFQEFGLTDILSMIGSVADTVANTIDDTYYTADTHTRNRNADEYSYSSSAKAASSLIGVFPVLCSSNVSKDTAALLTKVIERKACVGFQLLFAASNLSNSKSGIEYFRKYHQNISVENATLDDYIDIMDNSDTSKKVIITTEEANAMLRSLKESYTQFYDDDYNPISLNEYKVEESASGYKVTIDVAKQVLMREASPSSGSPDKLMAELKDFDAKKINEAVPSLLVIRFTNSETNTVTSFVIGVKAKLIPTDYMEILTKIYTKNKDGRGLVNFIRMTSGEMKFVRDYLLAIDQSRDAILSMQKRGSKEHIWKILENRANKSKWLLSRNKNNSASAITTVVITNEDADLLYKEENIDIRKLDNAKAFMRAYNLFGFVIVNETSEEAMFLYDEQDPYFESIAFTNLERETSDGQYKKIVNLMSKMR